MSGEREDDPFKRSSKVQRSPAGQDLTRPDHTETESMVSKSSDAERSTHPKKRKEVRDVKGQGDADGRVPRRTGRVGADA